MNMRIKPMESLLNKTKEWYLCFNLHENKEDHWHCKTYPDFNSMRSDIHSYGQYDQFGVFSIEKYWPESTRKTLLQTEILKKTKRIPQITIHE